MKAYLVLSILVYLLHTVHELLRRDTHLTAPEFKFSRYPYRMDLPDRAKKDNQIKGETV